MSTKGMFHKWNILLQILGSRHQNPDPRSLVGLSGHSLSGINLTFRFETGLVWAKICPDWRQNEILCPLLGYGKQWSKVDTH